MLWYISLPDEEKLEEGKRKLEKSLWFLGSLH